MRSFAFILVLVPFLLSCNSSKKLSKVNTESQIFRYTVLASADTLFLGKEIHSLSVYGDGIDVRTHRIPMSYPGVESMYIKTRDDQTIDRQLFVYDSSYDFSNELNSYKTDLGEPDSIQIRPDLKVYYWDDGFTHFEMIEFQSKEQNQAYSILRNSSAIDETSFNIKEIESYRGNFTIRDIIATSEVFSLISGFDDAFLEGVSGSLPDSIINRVTPLANTYFDEENLYLHIVDYMSSELSTNTFTALSEWLYSDWFLKQTSISKSYTPELTIEEYAASLQNNQPPRDRVLAFFAFVEANKAGEFFLGIQEASRTVTNEIYLSLGFPDKTEEPLTEEEKTQLKQQYNLSTLVSFLWAMEPLSNLQVQKMTDAYNTDSGVWYVQTYSDALAYSINKAGEELISELKQASL